MFSLTGRYEVDKDRSESLYTHMKALGCDEIAALASEKLRIVVDIVQNSSEIQFWQSSQLGDTKRVLQLEGETMEGDGKVANVSLTETGIEIFTTFPKGNLKDTRFYDEVDNGDIIQLLELKVAGNTITTKRLFKRLGPPDPSVTGA